MLLIEKKVVVAGRQNYICMYLEGTLGGAFFFDMLFVYACSMDGGECVTVSFVIFPNIERVILDYAGMVILDGHMSNTNTHPRHSGRGQWLCMYNVLGIYKGRLHNTVTVRTSQYEKRSK